MKAYVGGLHSDPDAGNVIVFAKNSKEAIKKVRQTEISDGQESFIDVYANRCPEFDDMEKLTEKELAKAKWREGWWFHQPDCPEESYYDDLEMIQTPDKEFYKWYESRFEKENIND